MILLQFLLTINLIVLISITLGDDLVEGAESTVGSYTSCILFTGRPDSFMSVTSLDIHFFHESFIRAVYHRVNFSWHFFKTFFSEVSILEWVRRRHSVAHVGEQSIIILGPVLLRLFQEEARLYFGVRLTLRTLDTPPLLTFEVLSELRQLTAVDADRYSAELGRVVGHHLSPSNLVQLLHGHLRSWHIRQNSQRTVLTFVHTGITVVDFAYVMFHLFQLVKHLLASVILEDRLRDDLGLFNKVDAGCLNFIFLVLVHIREVQLFASLLFQILTSLNNRLYSWFRPIELTVNVWTVL